MKLFLLLLHFMALPHLIQAAQNHTDTIPPRQEALLKELELTDEQKDAIKLLLVEYKLKERAQRRELKKRIFSLLTKRQRWKLKKRLQSWHPQRF
jgi:Spy/CpxP family protein refolding chaperone